MDLTKTTMFNMLKKRMDHSMARQKVLSQNVANADTPGYRSKDVRKLNFKQQLQAATVLQPAATNSKHLHGVGKPQKFRTEDQRKPDEVFISGNSVDVEDEMLKIGETRGAYNLATNLFKKNISMMKLAITKPQ